LLPLPPYATATPPILTSKRALVSGHVPVHWVIHFDTRGEHTFRLRCRKLNLVKKTVKGVEDELEFLIVP
jgi:hypothetical protein